MVERAKKWTELTDFELGRMVRSQLFQDQKDLQCLFGHVNSGFLCSILFLMPATAQSTRWITLDGDATVYCIVRKLCNASTSNIMYTSIDNSLEMPFMVWDSSSSRNLLG